MSSSYTSTQTVTFTLTHAKYLASKVVTDLKRIQRFYGSPSDLTIAHYETELIAFLQYGYLDAVTYGFQKDSKWIEPALKYTAKDLSELSSTDDDPGRVMPSADISGATFTSYLSHNANWSRLSFADQHNFKKLLPFQRIGAAEPGISGYLQQDKMYASGARALVRSIVKSY